jgi:hypothetical protein
LIGLFLKQLRSEKKREARGLSRISSEVPFHSRGKPGKAVFPFFATAPVKSGRPSSLFRAMGLREKRKADASNPDGLAPSFETSEDLTRRSVFRGVKK